MRYIAFIHGDEASGFGISFPDFPGCVSDGDTVENAIRRGSEALPFHVDGMLEDGETVPPPRSVQSVKADPELTEWRKGAGFAFVPLFSTRALLDESTFPWTVASCRPSTMKQGCVE